MFVRDYLGHSKLSTTDRYVSAKRRPQEFERLNRAFGSVPRERAALCIVKALPQTAAACLTSMGWQDNEWNTPCGLAVQLELAPLRAYRAGAS